MQKNSDYNLANKITLWDLINHIKNDDFEAFVENYNKFETGHEMTLIASSCDKDYLPLSVETYSHIKKYVIYLLNKNPCMELIEVLVYQKDTSEAIHYLNKMPKIEKDEKITFIKQVIKSENLEIFSHLWFSKKIENTYIENIALKYKFVSGLKVILDSKNDKNSKSFDIRVVREIFNDYEKRKVGAESAFEFYFYMNFLSCANTIKESLNHLLTEYFFLKEIEFKKIMDEYLIVHPSKVNKSYTVYMPTSSSSVLSSTSSGIEPMRNLCKEIELPSLRYSFRLKSLKFSASFFGKENLSKENLKRATQFYLVAELENSLVDSENHKKIKL